jgi:2-phosphosulfolactate phosphatase
MPRLSVHLLPDLVDESELAGATVVVIDVLRATTTITYALAAGAREVVPCLEIEDARQATRRFLSGEALLGGERGGVKIEGFDLGNSPEEYTSEVVKGRSVVFTTTNGTRAMMRCRKAKRVLIGSFVNLTAVQEAIEAEDNVAILCAGTDGQITYEDVLAAGAITACRCSFSYYKLHGRGEIPTLNDQAMIARRAAGHPYALWEYANSVTPAQRRSPPPRPKKGAVEEMDELLTELFADSLGGQNLIAIGRQTDLLAAAQIDKFDFVPELNLADWSIRRPTSIA